jgi:tetratricopeptide (TPR) repeat protein
MKSEKTTQNLEDLNAAILADPGNAIAFAERGGASLKHGDLDQALASYTKAVKLNPSFTSAFINRGNVYKAKGERKRARADYQYFYVRGSGIFYNTEDSSCSFLERQGRYLTGALSRVGADVIGGKRK